MGEPNTQSDHTLIQALSQELETLVLSSKTQDLADVNEPVREEPLKEIRVLGYEDLRVLEKDEEVLDMGFLKGSGKCEDLGDLSGKDGILKVDDGDHGDGLEGKDGVLVVGCVNGSGYLENENGDGGASYDGSYGEKGQNVSYGEKGENVSYDGYGEKSENVSYEGYGGKGENVDGSYGGYNENGEIVSYGQKDENVSYEGYGEKGENVSYEGYGEKGENVDGSYGVYYENGEIVRYGQKDENVGYGGYDEMGENVDGGYDGSYGGYGEKGKNFEHENVDGDGYDGSYGGYGGGWEEGGSMNNNNVVDGDNDDDGGMRSYHYPLRPDAEDCSYYMRTGMCKFGSNCRFNHPLRKRNQGAKDTRKQKDENFERHGPQQIECKYFSSSGGCKYGKACKYNHTKGKSALTPVLEYNFLGLPIRPGEKECPYYMRNGSCKYGPNCRFNHPDPTTGGTDGPATYGNGLLPLQTAAAQPNMPSWSAPRTPDPTAAYVPMMYSPTQNIPPPTSDWNGYQAPAPVAALPHVYPSSERGLPIPPAFYLNNPPADTNLYTHHQQPMPVSDYPERPGQPDCSYYMKTGDCKYKVSCKFNHPRNRITKNTPSVLSDKGLPLRPDQLVCSHYSRYGICKYGPACKYDHPVNYSSSGQQGYGQGGGTDGPLIQQSV
nr:zinc finger, CCCH-type [Tanacetum cinerariifolium]